MEHEIGGLYQKQDGVAVLWLSCYHNTLLKLFNTCDNYSTIKFSRTSNFQTSLKFKPRLDSFLSIVH